MNQRKRKRDNNKPKHKPPRNSKPSKKLSLSMTAPKPDLLLEQRSLFKPAPVRALPDDARLRITPRHFAYLKISEGCDRLCTFCAIPGMRGKHATKPIEMVISEAKELAADGVRRPGSRPFP